MSELIQELVIRVRADGSHEITKTAGALDQLGIKAQAAGAKGAAGMQQFAGATHAVRGAITSALGPIALITAAIAGFQKAITAASDADKSIRQMANSLQLAGSSMERDGARIQRSIKSLFDTTLYDDEALQDAFSNLLTMTGDVERALQALPVATNLAAKTGEDLGSAMQTIGMAAEGATRGLRKLGISFTAAESEAFGLMSEGKRLEIVLGLINERTSGAARANVTAWGGALKQAGKDLGEIWEAVGGWIFKALQAMDRYFMGLRDQIGRTLGLIRGHGASGSWESGAGILSGDAARAEIAKGVAAGIEAGARQGGPRAARIVADSLRQIPGLRYPTPQSLGDVFAGMDQVFDLERLREILSRTALKIPIFPEIVPSALQRIGRELSAQLGVTFGSALNNIFADLAETGGRNFGEIASQALRSGIGSAAQAFGNIVIEALGGGALQTNAAGVYEVGGQTFPNTPEGLRDARTARGRERYGNIAQGIAGAFGLYSAVANANPQSDTSTVLSGAAAGASLGTLIPGIGNLLGAAIGAVVGAIIAGIAAMSSSVWEQYQYASFGFRNGEAFVEPGGRYAGVQFQNIPANRRQAMLGQMQETFDTFRNGYIQILMQFPGEFSAGLRAVLSASANLFPRIGLDIGGDIGREGSRNFMQHFSEWVSGRLPRQIAEMFFAPLATAFEGVGLSQGRFRQIWDDLQDIDPRKAMELLGILAQGLIDISESMALFRMPSGFGDDGWSGGGYGAPGGLRGHIIARDSRTFAEQLRETDEEIFNLGESLEFLTGEDQIRTVGRIGELMRQRYEQEAEYLRGIMRMITEAGREIDAAIRGYQLDNIGDPQGQIDFLNQYLDDLYGQLGAASTPEEAQRIYREIFSTIGQIASIGGAQSPEDRRAYNDWAIDQLRTLGSTFRAIMEGFGAEIDSANAAFVARMEPMLEGFTDVAGVASSAAQALSEVETSGHGAASALYDMTEAARGFIEVANSFDLFESGVRASRVN